jgi:hypothetical protein
MSRPVSLEFYVHAIDRRDEVANTVEKGVRWSDSRTEGRNFETKEESQMLRRLTFPPFCNRCSVTHVRWGPSLINQRTSTPSCPSVNELIGTLHDCGSADSLCLVSPAVLLDFVFCRAPKIGSGHVRD